MLYPMQETLLHRCLTALPAFDASDSMVLILSAIVCCDVFCPGLAALYLITVGGLPLGRAVGGAAEC
jgi:hypothetical protein